MNQLLTVNEGKQTGETIYFDLIECCNCGIPFMVPLRFKECLRRDKTQFYCPVGHPQSYRRSNEEIKIEKYERELQEKDNQLIRERQLVAETAAQKNKLERQLKKVHRGMCPCCNRSFSNLQEHMKNQHPEIVQLPKVAEVHKKINKKSKL